MKKSCLIILVKALNFSVNAVVVSCLLLLFACGCYKIYDSHEIYQRADSDFATYQSPGIKPKKKMVSFDKLKKLNPDVFGWLEVEGTNISYPVLKCSDNLKYVNTDVKGKFSLVGGIFLIAATRLIFRTKTISSMDITWIRTGCSAVWTNSEKRATLKNTRQAGCTMKKAGTRFRFCFR